jgi:hypothetical protein
MTAAAFGGFTATVFAAGFDLVAAFFAEAFAFGFVEAVVCFAGAFVAAFFAGDLRGFLSFSMLIPTLLAWSCHQRAGRLFPV